MKNFLILICFSIASTLAGQDFMDLFYTSSQPSEIVNGIDTIYETDYLVNSYDGPMDSVTITIAGEEIQFYKDFSRIITYPGFLETKTENYNKENALSHIEMQVQDKQGRVVLLETEFETLKMMNDIKEYNYDDQGRLQSISSNGKELLNMTFDKNGYPDKIIGDMGFMRMKLTPEKRGDTIRYNMAMEISGDDPLMAMMLKEKGSDIPEMYIDVCYKDDLSTFKSVEENKEGQMETRTMITRDHKGRVVESKEYSRGELSSDHSYSYNRMNQIIETKDHLSDVVTTQEIDEDGKILVEYDEYYKYVHTYNEKNDRIKTTKYFNGSETFLQAVTIRRIVYK